MLGSNDALLAQRLHGSMAGVHHQMVQYQLPLAADRLLRAILELGRDVFRFGRFDSVGGLNNLHQRAPILELLFMFHVCAPVWPEVPLKPRNRR